MAFLQARWIELVDGLAQLGQLVRQRSPGGEQLARRIEAPLQHPAAHGRRRAELPLTEPIDRGHRPQELLGARIERRHGLDVLGDGPLDLLRPGGIDRPGLIGPGGLGRVRLAFGFAHRRATAPCGSYFAPPARPAFEAGAASFFGAAAAAGFGAAGAVGAAVLAAGAGFAAGAAFEPSPLGPF